MLLRARLGAVAAYRFSNLTSAIADRRSPLRRYLDEHFPHVRAVQRAYREPPRQLLVRGGPSDPAAIGAAYDLGVRFVIDPAHSPSIALYGFVTEPRLLAVVDAWLCGLDAETFDGLLPLVRRTFATIVPAERRTIGEIGRAHV